MTITADMTLSVEALRDFCIRQSKEAGKTLEGISDPQRTGQLEGRKSAMDELADKLGRILLIKS